MRYQAILYDPATGRIRQVLDPEQDMTEAEVIALIKPEPHEAVSAYPKGVSNRLHEWQAHVTKITGKLPADLHPEIKAHVQVIVGITET